MQHPPEIPRLYLAMKSFVETNLWRFPRGEKIRSNFTICNGSMPQMNPDGIAQWSPLAAQCRGIDLNREFGWISTKPETPSFIPFYGNKVKESGGNSFFAGRLSRHFLGGYFLTDQRRFWEGNSAGFDSKTDQRSFERIPAMIPNIRPNENNERESVTPNSLFFSFVPRSGVDDFWSRDILLESWSERKVSLTAGIDEACWSNKALNSLLSVIARK